MLGNGTYGQRVCFIHGPLWVGCEMPPTGLGVSTFCPRPLVLLGKVVKPKGGGVSVQEVGLWSWALTFCSPAPLPDYSHVTDFLPLMLLPSLPHQEL